MNSPSRRPVEAAIRDPSPTLGPFFMHWPTVSPIACFDRFYLLDRLPDHLQETPRSGLTEKSTAVRQTWHALQTSCFTASLQMGPVFLKPPWCFPPSDISSLPRFLEIPNDSHDNAVGLEFDCVEIDLIWHAARSLSSSHSYVFQEPLTGERRALPPLPPSMSLPQYKQRTDALIYFSLIRAPFFFAAFG